MGDLAALVSGSAGPYRQVRAVQEEGGVVVQTEELKVVLAVTVWAASSSVVGSYLYFSGRLSAYIKQVYPDVWQALSNNRYALLTEFSKSWTAWGVLRLVRKSLHDPELDRLANIVNGLALACMVAILASFGAVYLLPESLKLL
jgi:hypothetical protein